MSLDALPRVNLENKYTWGHRESITENYRLTMNLLILGWIS